jgi:hypothetical protein
MIIMIMASIIIIASIISFLPIIFKIDKENKEMISLFGYIPNEDIK